MKLLTDRIGMWLCAILILALWMGLFFGPWNY